MFIANTFHICACTCKTTVENTFYMNTSPSRAIIEGIFSLDRHIPTNTHGEKQTDYREHILCIHLSQQSHYRRHLLLSCVFLCVPVCSYVCSYREHILYKHLSQQSHHRRHLLLSCPGLPPPFFLLPTAPSPSLQSLHRRGTPLLFELL
jgi:hypothetical protein